MFQADIVKRTGPRRGQGEHPLAPAWRLFRAAFPVSLGVSLSAGHRALKAVGRPVKLIWSREEEFLRDPMRPMAAVRFRGAMGKDGLPTALEAISACEGPTEAVLAAIPTRSTRPRWRG